MLLKLKIARLGFLVLLAGALGLLVYGFVHGTLGSSPFATKADTYSANTRLLVEIFDSVKKNYWEVTDEKKLTALFGLAVQKVVTTPPLIATSTSMEFADYLEKALASKPETERKDATLAIGELVLSNLTPFGRSHIFTTSQEKDLRDTVSNINPGKDLYASLGVPKDASPEAIEKEYGAKLALLKKEKTPEAEREIKDLAYAKDVLTDTSKKNRYDTQKIEPTLFLKALSSSTLYLNLTKFSPTTLNEFVDIVKKMSASPKARTLIIDMRGNIGGSSDIVPYLSGFFIGPGQYAFDLFRQGTYTPFKTPTQKISELSALKQTIVLIDGNTQSSAELFASVLKKYNKATVVGTHSKGWGTIENTFPLATTLGGNKYTLFLVHSVTIRDDGEPIEGRGVDPDIDSGAKNWQKMAKDRFEDTQLVSLLTNLLKI